MKTGFFPKLTAVEAVAPPVLRTTWSTGEVLDVDVSRVLGRVPTYARLLDPDLFATVHLGEGGTAIAWFDDELGPDNVYAWAKEQRGEVSHQMFDEWMHRNGLSLTTAAEALGLSRRMVSYYRTAQKPIPRQTWLACLGWEATRPAASASAPGNHMPRALPSAREYAAAHV